VVIEIRRAETDADLEAWRWVRRAVLPDERAPSVAELRAAMTDETVYLLAELDGELAGSGYCGRSSFGYASLQPRVVPALRRRGVGNALLRASADHALRRGLTEAGSTIDDPALIAFAERFGFHEVDLQVEQVRTIGAEAVPPLPDGIVVVTVAERPELWSQAYDDLALEAIADMAAYRPLVVSRDEWQCEWLASPEAMFLALDGGRIVGCAGLERDTDRPDRAEHAFTAVDRSWRRRGLATALKRLTLAYAAEHGIREVYTWTQRDNADMRALNKRLGYVTRAESITVRGRLPLPA
jgi:RimJ/RimL family protein N-acetyltransferase